MATGSIHNGGSTGGGGGGTKSFVLSGSGRFYGYTDNRWTGAGTNYGQLDQNFSQNFGTGNSPAIVADSAGFPIFAGMTLNGFTFEADASNAEVTGADIDISLRQANGILVGLKRYLGVPITMTKAGGLSIYDSTLAVAIPANGALFVSVRPVGVLTATRYIYAGFGVFVG